jgi:hypothetical protein
MTSTKQTDMCSALYFMSMRDDDDKLVQEFESEMKLRYNMRQERFQKSERKRKQDVLRELERKKKLERKRIQDLCEKKERIRHRKLLRSIKMLHKTIRNDNVCKDTMACERTPFLVTIRAQLLFNLGDPVSIDSNVFRSLATTMSAWFVWASDFGVFSEIVHEWLHCTCKRLSQLHRKLTFNDIDILMDVVCEQEFVLNPSKTKSEVAFRLYQNAKFHGNKVDEARFFELIEYHLFIF